VGLGNLCTPDDQDLFAAATKVTIRNGEKASFGESSWLDGMCPKDIAPKIFEIARKRKCTVKKPLTMSFGCPNSTSKGGFRWSTLCTSTIFEICFKMFTLIKGVRT
jgi:hypothetical protein